jgi:hypothetical protein
MEKDISIKIFGILLVGSFLIGMAIPVFGLFQAII